MSERNEPIIEQQPSDEQIRRYFVGELSQAERSELEDRCFADDALFEEMQAVEAELTDDYVSGALSERERVGFAQHLSNKPERNGELSLARLLMNKAKNQPAMNGFVSLPKTEKLQRRKVTFVWERFKQQSRFAFAVLLLVIVATAGLWFWFERRRQAALAPPEAMVKKVNPQPSPLLPSNDPEAALNSQNNNAKQPVDSDSSKSEQTAESNVKTPRALTRKTRLPNGSMPKTPAQSSARTMISIMLVPGAERSSGRANEIRLSPIIRQVQLKLLIETNVYQSYEVAARKIGGRVIWRQNKLLISPTKNGKIINLTVSSKKLPRGTLLLALRGVTKTNRAEEIANYVLFVIRP